MASWQKKLLQHNSIDLTLNNVSWCPLSWIVFTLDQADHNFTWTTPGHQIFTLKVYMSALKSRMTMCKMSPINLFWTFFLKMHDHNHQWCERRGLGQNLTNFENHVETQFWVNNDAKLTKNWKQLLPAAAASAICCTKMVKNKVGL